MIKLAGGEALDEQEVEELLRWRPAVFVAIVGDQQTDLEKHRSGIDEFRDALAGRELAVAVLLFDFGGTAARPEPVFELLQFLDLLAHALPSVVDAGGRVQAGFRRPEFGVSPAAGSAGRNAHSSPKFPP